MPDKFYIDSKGNIRLVPEGKEQKFLSKYPGSREATRKELSDFEDRRVQNGISTPRGSDIQDGQGRSAAITPANQPLNGFNSGFGANQPQKMKTRFKDGTEGYVDIPVNTNISQLKEPDLSGISAFKGKPLKETISNTMQNMPVSPEAYFDMSVDRYRQEKDWVEQVKNDSSLSENVKQSLINDYLANTRTPDLTVADKDLPPAAKDWLERNKVSRELTHYNPSVTGGGSYPTTVKENTPEQTAFIKDYIANSEEGKRYAQAHKEFIGQLEGDADILLNRIESIREASEKNKEAYAGRHNISAWSLKGTNYRNDAILGKAANLLKNTKLLLSASKEGDGFRKGLHLTNEDLKELAVLTESFYNDKALNQVIDKYQKAPGSLSEEEAIIIQAKYIADQINAGVDPGSWYNIGQTTKQSLPFMRDFMLTAPIGGAAASAVKGGASALAAKTGANLLLSRGIGGTASSLAKGAIDLSVRPAVQTMFSPSSYAMAYQEMQGQAVNKDGQGNIMFGNRKSQGQGMTSAFIENQSEVLGEVVLDKLFQKFRIPVPAFLKTNAAKRLSSATGIQGPITEYAEEKYADLANIVRGEQTIEGFFDPRQNLETFGAVAIMQIPFSAINATGYGIGRIRDVQAKRAIRQTYDRSADSLNKYFGEDAPQAALAFNKLVDNSSEEELKQELLSVVGDERLDDNGKRAIVEYVTACSAYSGMNKAKQEDIQQAEQQMAWLADENINLQMNAVVSAVIAGNGNPVQVTGGNIVQREDGSIDSEASDKQIFYVDAEGNKQVTSIDFIESIGENIPAQDAIAQLIEMETANIISRQENEEVREYQPGETVTADVAGNGITFTGEVTGITQSGNYIIVSPVTGEQVEAEPRHIINQDNIQGVENGSLVEYRNERGERVQGTVNDAYGLRPQGMMDIDGNGVPVAGIIGLVSQLTVNSKQLTQESDNLQATTPESADNLQATGQQNKDIPAGEQDNLTPAGQIPKDEKGNLLFEQAPVEATIGALSEVYNDTAELSGVVDATIGNIRKQIDKAKAPKPTGDINKDIAGKRAANQQLEELNNRLSYWEEVRKAIQESKPLRQQITEQLTNVSNDNNISFNEPENNEKRVELGDSIFTPDNSSVPDETAGDEAEKSSPAFGANNKLVSTERYEELKKRMRDKLNNLNIGIDPELFAIGAEMAVYNIEAGARKFADFAGRMIDDLGDNIRPYLKAFYEGARQMPGMETIREEMDSFQIVNSFDVDSIRTGEEASPINREEIESFAGVLANDILSRPESLEKYFNNDRQKQDIVFDSLFGSAMLNHRKEHVSAYKQFVEHEEFSRELKNKVKSLLNEYGQRRKNEKPVTGNAETIVRELNNHYLRSGLDTEKEQEEAAGHPAESEQRLTPAFDEEKPINGTDILTGGDDFIKNHIVTGTIAKTDVQTRQDSNKNNTGRLPDRMRQSAGGMDDRAPAGGTVPDDAGRYAERLPEQDRTGRDEGGEADDKQRDESGGSRVPGHQQGGTALRPDGDGRTGTGGRTAEPRKDTGSGGIPGDHPVLNRNNFRTGDKDNIVPKGAVSKIRANIKAIGLLKKLEEEGRDATDNEKQILSQYSGWGGLAEVLNTTRKGESSWREKYGEYHDRIISLLTPEEFTAAENSTINAHYTSGGIIAEMWKLAERLGFKGGRVLEPALGTGNFFGLMPEHISSKSSLRAYELDSITGRIAAKLYPDARIQVKGYEESKDRDTDLIITNVPFGQKAPYDSANRDICDFSLHNYFIAKGIKQLAPGGLGLFITSKSTMDSAASAKLREWVTTKGYADLIGAIRLPNTAFSENAGTEVTTDILVFRKRDSEKPGRYAKDFRFTNDIKEVKMRDGSPTVIEANEYFAQNPDMMLGELKLAYEDNKGGLYSGDDVTLAPHRGQDLIKALDEAIRSFPAGISDIENANFNEKAESGEKEGTMVDRDGHIYEVIDGELSVPGWINENTTTVRNKKVPRVKVARHYLRIKDIAGKLIDAEREDKDNIEELRAELNREYDSFYNEYGRFNDNIKLRFLVDTDVEYNTVFALEKVKRIKEVDSQGNEKTITDIGKADIFSKRILFPVREPVQADNIADALEISLSYRGSLDLNYIAGLTGLSADEAKEKLRDEGLAFTNPSTSLLEDRDSYLSGYVRSKYYEALEAARTEPEFERNVKALEPVIPKDIPGTQIKIRLGSTFIPDKYYEEFAREKLKADAKIAYRPELNKYVVQLNSGRDSAENKTTYGTSYFSGIQLIEKGLNLKQPVAFDIFYEGGQPKRIKNQEKTAEAQAMLSSIADLFVNYIYDNEQAMSEIERVYNDKYNDYVEKSYSVPGIVHYPGANKDITLRQHQKRAVSRGLRDSVLLAHQVGTGKTFTKITIAMEMRRLGIAKKPMIAVQNATLEQYVASFRALYPGANILAPTKKMMDAKNRTRLFSLIAYGDYDAVIIPHSFLYMIPDDPQRQRDYLNEQIAELQNVLSDVNEDQDRVLHEELTRKIEQLQESLDEIDNPGKEKKSKKGKKVKDKAKKQLGVVRRITRQADRRTDNVLTFEKMGVDALIVDEAHNFKRLGLITKMGSVKGIDTSGSKRAYGVYMKVRYIHERTGGKNIVFATGTPITNTMAEAWTMMRYIEPDVLEKYDIGSFDRFATTFGSVEPSLEFTATGNFKVVDRFKSFINAPELFTAFRVKADVVLTEDIPEFKEGNTIPKLKGGSFTQVIVPQSSLLVEVMNQLKDKMKWWENLSPREKKKNRSVPIVVFGRAKQAAIDLRLINPALPDDPESKTNRVIAEVKRIYDASSHYRGTQLIFSDLFQSSAKIPGKRFNLYEDIKEKLVALGIPEHEVAIIHDYDEKNREKLFERVNEGLVRIVIGNTEKMGVGVNMQKRAVALHHIDAPARPMDFEQRNGRILRQGNLHAQMGIPVEVLTYGVEKTLDATAYQRLAIKQSFINQVMKGDSLDREISDEAEEDSPSDMDFMQMMAVLSGSKYAQLHFLKSAELKKLETAERNHLRRQVEINKQIKDYTVYKEYREVELETLNRVKSLLDTYFPEGKITSVTINGKKQDEKLAVAIDEAINDYKKTFVSALKTHMEMPALEVRFNSYPQAMELDYIDLINDNFRYFYKTGDYAMKGMIQTGAGLLNSLRSRIANIPGEIQEAKDKIGFYGTNIPVLKSELLKPFDKGEKLEHLRKEIAEIAEKMKAEVVTDKKEASATGRTIDSSMIDLEATEEGEDGEVVSYGNEGEKANGTDYRSNEEDGEEDEETEDTVYPGEEKDVNNTDIEETQEGIIDTVSPYKHTQTGQLFYLARIKAQVPAPVFSGLKDKAKSLNGSWSRFAKGFLFEDESKANEFRNRANSSGDIRRQALSSGSFRSITAERFGRLIDKLNRTGLAVDVVSDEDIRNNPEIKDTQGNVYGYVTPDGVIHLDVTRMNANTPVHEFGHLWNSFIKENNPELWKKGVELIKESDYWQRVNDIPAYKNLSEEAKVDEALAMAIGDKGESVFHKQNDLSLYMRVKGWLYDVWSTISKKLGISPGKRQVTIEDMSLSDFTDRAVRDLFGGERLVDNPVQSEETRMQSVNDIATATNSAMTAAARRQLDGRLKNFRFRIREAWEDRHLAVKEFLDVLRRHGTDIAGYNDYYKQATHINGKIDAGLENYNEKFQKPLNKAVGELEKAGFDYRAIENYAILKHGLERNKWMKEDAVRRYAERYPDATPQQLGRFEINLPDDFSGITAVEAEVGTHAEGFIAEFEHKAGEELIYHFWKSVKNATLFSIGKQLEGGLIDKKTYDELAGRYDYYIPLRGHDDETAEDRWDYSPNMGTYFVAPLIRAKGRRTRSESPLAFIFSMAQSAVSSANRNILNQTILRLALKDKTGLLGVNKAWYMQTGLNEDGVPVYEIQAPAYSENTDQYRINIEEFEERMQKLQEQGLAVQNRGKLDIGGLFIKKTQASQHVVYVSQNGAEYAVYINGNPAVARAINGINAKDLHKDLRFIAKVSRQMAANFTTRNPIFVATNFSRDYIFASSILGVKEDAKYALQFQSNIPRSAGALQRYIRNKADLSEKADRYVIEYIMNGGKTGFSHLVELDAVRRKIEREIKKGDSKSVLRTFLDALEGCNEFAENLSRLSVYITSREQGRPVVQSISDAKEVTVNFNRNGAGGYGAAWFRSLYLFVNAGIQALSNFAKVAQKNKGKTAILVSSYAMSGFLMPLLTALTGGDDGLDDYMKLSDWERQNNLCIYTGSGFVKIPLPHELRVFHAMGDNIYQAVFGRKDIAETLPDVILSFSDLIPANPAGSIRGSWADMMPDAVKPFFQLKANRNYTGGRITNEWADENKPGYLRIRTNKKGEPYAPAFLVKLGESLDKATGGDGVEKGIVSFNPDEVNHLIHGYFGGLYATGMQVLDMSYKAYDWTDTGELKLKVRETPLKTFYTSGSDLMTAGSGLNPKYFKIADDMQETRRKVKGYKEQAQKGDLTTEEFAAKINSFSPDIERYKRIYPYIKQIRKYESALKELDGEEQKEAEKIIANLKKEVVQMY